MSDAPSILERLTAALADRYRIERELGQGGMATVYRAEDLKHGRKVAIKVLKPELAAVIGAERFLSEIRTTANLQHPHILALHDSGEADGFLFYVMPFIDGESLRDRLDREGQLPVDQALALTRKVAGALQYAHEQGVLHRDVKPANILLSRGEPLVADFGIALALSEAGGGRITETGLSLGTPHYMSPEQATGERALDPRSDIYALACILYEMLAGQPPHAGPSAQAVLARILTQRAPDITELRHTVPPHVASALARALEKLPADRFATVAEFAEALDDPGFRYSAGPATSTSGDKAGTASRGTSPVTRTGLVTVLAATVVVLAAAAVAGWLRPVPQGPAPILSRVRLTLPDTLAKQVTTSTTMDISRDGRAIVYVGPASRDGLLMYRPLDQLDSRPLRGTEGALTPAFSPDGTRVAFTTGLPGALKVVNLDGSAPITVRQDSVYAYGLSWGDDGYVYLANESSVVRMRAEGGALELVTGPAAGAVQAWHGWPEAIPGGRYIFVTMYGGSLADTRFGIYDVQSGELTDVAPGFHPRWVEPDAVVYVRADGTVMGARLDLEAQALTDVPVVLFDGIAINAAQAIAELDVSPNGTMVYQVGEAALQELVWVDRSGGVTPVDTAFTGAFSGLVISEDGSTIAVSAEVGRSGDIYARAVDRGPARRITFEDTPAIRPAWIPGTNRVSYVQNPPSQVDVNAGGSIWGTSANGSGDASSILDVDLPIQEVAWSPDGQWLVYRVGPFAGQEQRDVLAVSLGSQPDTIPLLTSPFDEYSPAVSPDGRWIAYVSNESGRQEIFVRSFPDVDAGKWQVSSNGGTEPVWSRSGQELFYRSAGSTLVAVDYVTDPSFAVRSRTPLFSIAGLASDPYHAQYDVDPLNERFLFARSLGSGQELVLVQNWQAELQDRLGPSGGSR